MPQHSLKAFQIGVLAIGLAACAAAPTPAAPTVVVANPTVASAPTAAPAPTATTEPAVPTTTIIKAYETDQAAADAQYQGKTLRMTGKVTNINDVFDVKALMLRDSENDTGLQCYLTDSADAQKVSIGQTIMIEGMIKGGELGPFM
ncbi:MAG TPA: hypothetical protein VLG46_09915, partial [Anaerolineae bacterium]|nr:hypothetical protein [Anaerolineae bacterium]